MIVGVVDVQGGVAPHAAVLARLGAEVRAVRRPAHLRGVAALILPGGESTAQRRLLDGAHLIAPLHERVCDGMPALLTCAGLVLGCVEAQDPPARGFGWIDVDVRRNGFGPQSESRVERADTTAAALVLIRAPRVVRVGRSVETLATLRGEPVLVRQGNVTGATYHPELTDDDTVHAALFAAAGGLCA